jgi:hypothetical protein
MWLPADRFLDPDATELAAGFRGGDRGTHSSRTFMLAEVTELLGASPPRATRDDFLKAAVDENALGKPTASGRRLALQRLGELYGLDSRTRLFRVFQRLWLAENEGRPQLALLCALARDPLLRASAPAVMSLQPGVELLRGNLVAALRSVTRERLNDAILDKVARNVASSWSQAGYLDGRVRKIRHTIEPTPAATAFALWLGSLRGASGEALLSTRWAAVLDRSPAGLLPLALRAAQRGLIHARVGGGVTEIDPSPLEQLARSA